MVGVHSNGELCTVRADHLCPLFPGNVVTLIPADVMVAFEMQGILHMAVQVVKLTSSQELMVYFSLQLKKFKLNWASRKMESG